MSGMVNKTKTIQLSRPYMYLTWFAALIVITSAAFVAWPYIYGLVHDGPEMAGVYLLILAFCVAPVYMAIRMLFGSIRFLLVLAMYCTVVMMLGSVVMLISSYLSAPMDAVSWGLVGAAAPFAVVVMLFVCIQNALKNGLIAGRLYTVYYGLTWAFLFELLCAICIQQISNFATGYLGLLGCVVAGVLAVWGVASGRRYAFALAGIAMLGVAGLTVFDAMSGGVYHVNAVGAVLLLQCTLIAMFGVMAYVQKR
jgi:hypothetical protein